MARADRPPPEDGSDVDFVVGAPDEGVDEDLLPPDGEHERARRVRVRIALGAVALLVAVLIGRAALEPGSAPQAGRSASPTTSAPTAPPPTGPVTAPPYLYKGNLPPGSGMITVVPRFPKRIPARRGSTPSRCPGHRCSSSPTLPGAVSSAVRAAFPESSIERSRTVRLRSHGRVLWYREVDARAGSQRLTLRVQAPASSDRTGSGHRTSNGTRTTFVDTSLGPWHVEVEAVDLTGGQVPTEQLTELAHDPWIVAD